MSGTAACSHLDKRVLAGERPGDHVNVFDTVGRFGRIQLRWSETDATSRIVRSDATHREVGIEIPTTALCHVLRRQLVDREVAWKRQDRRIGLRSDGFTATAPLTLDENERVGPLVQCAWTSDPSNRVN